MSAVAWYVARSSGSLAYLLLSASVVLGVLMAGRARFTWPHRSSCRSVPATGRSPSPWGSSRPS